MICIWHTPPAEPDMFRQHPIIVVYEAGDQIEQMMSTEYAYKTKDRYVNRWCYTDDLIKFAEEMLKDIEYEGLCSWQYKERLNKITALEQKD